MKKVTKKEIREATKTIKKATAKICGKYHVTVDQTTFDNYTGKRNEIVSYPDGNYDTNLTVYDSGGISLDAENKRDFIRNVIAAINRNK